MTIRVSCSECGWLGDFFVTIQQTREGAYMRAIPLANEHKHKGMVDIFEVNRQEVKTEAGARLV